MLGTQWPLPSLASVQGIGNPATQGSQEKAGRDLGRRIPRIVKGGPEQWLGNFQQTGDEEQEEGEEGQNREGRQDTEE